MELHVDRRRIKKTPLHCRWPYLIIRLMIFWLNRLVKKLHVYVNSCIVLVQLGTGSLDVPTSTAI